MSSWRKAPFPSTNGPCMSSTKYMKKCKGFHESKYELANTLLWFYRIFRYFANIFDSQSFSLVIFGEVGQIQLFTSDLLVKAQYIFSSRLEMWSSIETVRDKHSVTKVFNSLVSLGDSCELFPDWANQIESILQLLFWFIGLYDCADDGEISIFLANAMDSWDHHNIYILINRNLPFFLLTCLWGIMIWTEGIFSVLGIGWSKIHIHLMTFYTNLTLSFNPHFIA